ncbi:serine/threonine protein kinase BUD32 [Aspergillus saccharolyticus JOP 1030-1]|uniref:EKC/KEOPS complex subunit BUD32 n=1 Tax=Aspergillus saccharolyticus JOP 1030-1 TaxID=1450539 RepID=A0A318ZPQ2_9EURO|nr:hypothetical protein BP01DRAFT_353751 [Aspergillus saccharolyticus JOP 1030-1]PYH48615.1 hypothetical protein BP01DRAFT_353751 [Aspergillus saccharolyticus JOP 1030-1]
MAGRFPGEKGRRRDGFGGVGENPGIDHAVDLDGDGDGDAAEEHVERKREEERMKDLLRRIGRAVGALHAAGVIHGDLTTSNLILRPSGGIMKPQQQQQQELGGEEGMVDLEGEVVLIDFGLASQSVQDEDRAVDLYVLERAFGSTHPRTEQFFAEVLEGYRASYRGAASVLKRLEEVRMRGRKKSMLG